ncbi:ubiquinol-cytochrome c reductase iron-sulfur subunit [Acidobacteria bacterium AB60]|nr:ubiquinol-cytochrome c reductase iron-sulfur subunit [Acidobacteria bacterium AB60]
MSTSADNISAKHLAESISGAQSFTDCDFSQNSDCGACLKQEAAQVSRRAFFASMLGACAGAIASVIGLPILRYVLYPVQNAAKGQKWTLIGDAQEFENIAAPVTKTIALVQRDGWREVVSEQAVFVTRSDAGQLRVLSPICPHLGCSVSWHDKQNKFICPCHGGQFSADGSRISGPPPRGLDVLDAEVKDGKLQVQFQYFKPNVPDRQLLS